MVFFVEVTDLKYLFILATSACSVKPFPGRGMIAVMLPFRFADVHLESSSPAPIAQHYTCAFTVFLLL